MRDSHSLRAARNHPSVTPPHDPPLRPVPAEKSPGRNPEELRGPAVLIVAASHGLPPNRARLERTLELAAGLGSQGFAVDLILLLERPLEAQEDEILADLESSVRSLEIVQHPAVKFRSYKTLCRIAESFSFTSTVGGGFHCPRRLVARVQSACVAKRYRAVLACGAHLAPALKAAPPGTERLLDYPRILSDAYESHRAMGRPDEHHDFRDPATERRLLSLADALLAGCAEDAARLRSRGLRCEVLVVPPSARASTDFTPPLRPPRVLCVGSETVANLDGVRWFRKNVYPAILQLVPSCRLRLVGELARHTDPAPGVDRIGWVENLAEEYANAALVALPLRMGAGVHRRAIAAAAHGRVLCTTPVGAWGTGLVPQVHAIVSPDPAFLAAEARRVLTSDNLRRSYERKALLFALEAFSPGGSSSLLAQRLGADQGSVKRSARGIPAGAGHK